MVIDKEIVLAKEGRVTSEFDKVLHLVRLLQGTAIYLWKMEAVLHLLLLLLLTGQGFSQCFSSTNCTGGLVVAADQRACCVGTDDGLSFNNGTSCNLCIGMSVVARDLVLAS